MTETLADKATRYSIDLNASYAVGLRNTELGDTWHGYVSGASVIHMLEHSTEPARLLISRVQ